MNQKTQKRSVNFPSETLKTLDKLAAREHTTTSELIRNFVEEGLKVNGYEEQVDFIARIIRQEITAVYHVDRSSGKNVNEDRENQCGHVFPAGKGIDSSCRPEESGGNGTYGIRSCCSGSRLYAEERLPDQQLFV